MTNDPIAAARAGGRLLLSEIEAKGLLAAAGVPVTPTTLATSAEEAVAQAEAAGYPVVLKIVSPDISHKSDVGGVRLGLADAAAVRAAYAAILAAVQTAQPTAQIAGVAVQHQEPAASEAIVGLTTDPQFGPVVMFGLGGVMVEVLQDVAFRVVPLSRRDAQEMVREIAGLPLLQGHRGAEPADLTAIEDVILAVAAYAEAHPEVAEIDLNPLFVGAQGAVAVDARIVLAPEREEAA